jgi:drug/metabolite transporter (DMT)-like permease
MLSSWLSFLFLALIWGSSYLFIKVTVREIDPLSMVWVRLAVASAIFCLYLRFTGRTIWPKQGRYWLLLIGVLNTALPFVLISWGQKYMDSSLGTILTATTPLFSMTLAHFFVEGEFLTRAKSTGLLLGFVGVVILSFRVGKGLTWELWPLLGQSAILFSAACYAVSLIVMRLHLKEVEPIVIAGNTLLVGALVLTPITLFFAAPFEVFAVASAKAWGFTLLLGILHTVVAYFLFYALVAQWGPRASMVTYAMPPVGVTLGVVFLGEHLDWRLLAGGILILLGILLVQGRLRFGRFARA